MVFYCFDLLHFAGIDLRKAPYRDRRRYLAQCLLPSPLVQLVHAAEDGVALHAAALASGFEGVIGKRKDSRYEAGRRSASWLKVKPTQSADFVVGGYTKGKGSRAPLGALLVGYWEGGKLRYASHVGSGFDERIARAGQGAARAAANARPVRSPRSRSCNAPDDLGRAEARRRSEVPELDRGRLTCARRCSCACATTSIRRRCVARADRAAAQAAATRGHAPSSEIDEVVAQLENSEDRRSRSRSAPHRIRLTHLDRVYWPADPALKQPALTKRDLLRYFAQVSPFMLPHLADRPLTMIRMPDGIRGQRFFQKHWEQERPGVRRDDHRVLRAQGREPRVPAVQQPADAAVARAVRHARIPRLAFARASPGPTAARKSTDYASSLESLEGSVLNYPDYVVFDIDPYIYSGQGGAGRRARAQHRRVREGQGGGVLAARAAARACRSSRSSRPRARPGCTCSCRSGARSTSTPRATCRELVGRHLMRQHPKDITLEWSVPKRTGKIFMDYNMNVRGKTLNVAYSPRGEPGAPVSMPLTWEELAKRAPARLQDHQRGASAWRRPATAGATRLKRKQSLERALERAKA